MTNNGRVLVAMSGGVDSSAAALILLREGYSVEGATFLLRDDPDDSTVRDAEEVCRRLGIAHRTLDYRELFRREVTDSFADEYRRGATPNPCVTCNRCVKFGAFIPDAVRMGFDYIATGHYAVIERDGDALRIRKGLHAEKDQSYVLYTLTREQLERVLFPLGRLRKEEARELAREANLGLDDRPESQDICFVPDGDYRAFLEAYTGERPPDGDFIDAEGNVLGRHRGLWRYTIGQRKGLGVSFGRPLYVGAVNPHDNTVTLTDNASLFSRELTARGLCLIGGGEARFRCEAKIRYAARPAAAEVFPLDEGGVRVVFDEPQRAVTPGQAVVFYDGDVLLGGAVIE